MRRRIPAVLTVSLLTSLLFADALSAEVLHWRRVSREMWTLSTQAHPKKLDLTYLATERHGFTEIGVSYLLERHNWDPCCDIELETGGKIIATLDLITANGSQRLGKKKRAKCVNRIREDAFGDLRNERWCGLFWPKNRELEPGDLLLLTFKFKNMPALEHEGPDAFTLEVQLYPSNWPPD